MRHASRIASLLAIAIAPSLLASQTLPPQQPPPSPCITDSTYRQFDFWIGEWIVRPAAAPANAPESALPQSRVEKILNGCVLLENWMPPTGAGGKSFNTWNRASREWEQTWVDGMGNTVRFRGGMREGKMILTSESTTPNGQLQRSRMTFFNLGPDRVRQLWESSADSGRSWTVSFDGMYTRKR